MLKKVENIQISLKSEDSLDKFNTKNPEPLALSHKLDKIPRYYQINGVNKLNYYLKKGFKRILYIMPTGTGKTLQSKLSILSKETREILNLQHKKKIRVLFIVHKKRLLRQAAQEFAGCADIELITQSAFQSVPQHVIDEGWDITFIDEAHHEAMMSIQKLLDELGDMPIIGFTANPDRGDSLMVKFERFIVPISKGEAIEEGFISEPGINTIVDTGKQDKTDLAIKLVERYHKHMGNTIVFFKTNKECERFFDWCCEQGIFAEWLNTNSTEKQLDDALDRLSKGQIQFLINCKKVDEGIDVMNCTDVILARQFKTKSEKEQLIGRAIRPDTPCTVWEFQNPYIDSVEACQVIGSYRFRRLLNIYKGEWEEELFEGFDPEWGLASELRFEHIRRNLGYDPRTETEEHAIERKKAEGVKELKYEVIPEGGFWVSHLDGDHKPKSEREKTFSETRAEHVQSQSDSMTSVKPRPKVTKRIIYNAVEDELKESVKNMGIEELKLLAKRLIKEGKIT